MTESPAPSTNKPLGFANKPLIEKLKLIALFALIGLMIYLSHPIPKLFYPGAVLTALGALIRVWAGGHLTRDRRLAVSGPYQYTRNPFYLGRFCVLIGFALMSGLQNLWVWAIFLFGMAFFFFGYMPRKEKREGGRLEELFGDQFRQYRAAVPSLFPRPTPYKDPFTSENRRWSRDLFFGGTGEFSGNKELPTTIATFVLIALFFIRMVTPQ
ncbi:MAG: isoprenylcysteine carboxylmethyltransferase family protein [Armatimonadetes bacterium]|nr:isoprenylcysteine carboxylmethyltransferase family protein [Armatimonadota bacterium]